MYYLCFYLNITYFWVTTVMLIHVTLYLARQSLNEKVLVVTLPEALFSTKVKWFTQLTLLSPTIQSNLMDREKWSYFYSYCSMQQRDKIFHWAVWPGEIASSQFRVHHPYQQTMAVIGKEIEIYFSYISGLMHKFLKFVTI